MIRSNSGVVSSTGKRVNVEKAAARAVEEQEAYRNYRLGRVELIKQYAETQECRRWFLLNYFGEATDSFCGHCDTCDSGLSRKRADSKAEENVPYAVNGKVVHKKFGAGVVMRYEGDKVVILFDTEGYKSLVTEVVVREALVEMA